MPALLGRLLDTFSQRRISFWTKIWTHSRKMARHPMSTEPLRWGKELVASPGEENMRSLSLPFDITSSTPRVAWIDPRLCSPTSTLVNTPNWPSDSRPNGIASSVSSEQEFPLNGTWFDGKARQSRESNLVESKASSLRMTEVPSALDVSSAPGWKQGPDSICGTDTFHWKRIDQYDYATLGFESLTATSSGNKSSKINHCPTASSPGLEGNSINAGDSVEDRRRLRTSSSSKRTMEHPVPVEEGSIKRPRWSYQLPDSAMHSDESTDDENGMVKKDNLFLACPFFRYNAGRHTSCLNLKMRRVRDVKQHLKRRHSEPRYYCTTCYKMFTTEPNWFQHVLDNSFVRCSPAGGRPDFVTAREQQLLCAKASRNAALKDQWYAVWDQIFVDKPRPAHPFMRPVVEEVASMMREFWQNEGEQIVKKFTGPLRMRDGDEARLKNVMLNMMEESHSVFGNRFRSSTPAERSAAAPDDEQLPNRSSGLPRGEYNHDTVLSAPGLEQKALNGPLHQPCSRLVSDLYGNQTWKGAPAEVDDVVDIDPILADAGCTDLYKGAEDAIIGEVETSGWSAIDYNNQSFFHCPYLLDNGSQGVQMGSLPI
ncbi:hypothetical protein CTA2_7988 [Colletotrichum tanaceti]|uniref:C2H2-type domain-containing protein n=1 Tax=Colletotrichum tanaceti TaxID=1306861 RepID=A0A4U6WZZ7_9PEZI|nr:hypothetical protein CTA2_7988 [Colletotrichum tanaceti]TKW48670.1 hypothetical protein CTA1_5524 [Colletotrichum tanaceti]